jgi:uncharacterized low-complexity protein
MSDKKVATPIALAVGIALAGSFAAVEAAQTDAGASPFAMNTLSMAYMLGEGEGSCGGNKEDQAEGKGEEGSCGGNKEDDSGKAEEAEGSCGGDKAGEAEDKGEEGSCGGDKAGEAEDKGEEGKCGEGKCGGDV